MTQETVRPGILINKIDSPGILDVKIVSQAEIAESIFHLALEYPFRQVSAGQFINLYLNDRSMLLPRPVSVCSWEEGKIELIYRVAGKGTKELSGYKAGDSLRVSSPLGNGYDVDAVFHTLSRNHSRQRVIALVAGGLGLPPMVQLAKTIRKRLDQETETPGRTGADAGHIKLIAALGFREDPFFTEEMSVLCDEIQIASETGIAGFRGNVLELLKEMGFQPDYCLSCGPKPMLKELAGICAGLNVPLQVSLEERMGCGYGACVGCTCRTREAEGDSINVIQKKVCKDGPVFYGNEVIWDE